MIESHLCKIYKFAIIWQLYRLRLAPRLKRLSGLSFLSALVLSVAGVAGLPLIFPGSAGIKHWLFITQQGVSILSFKPSMASFCDGGHYNAKFTKKKNSAENVCNH